MEGQQPHHCSIVQVAGLLELAICGLSFFKMARQYFLNGEDSDVAISGMVRGLEHGAAGGGRQLLCASCACVSLFVPSRVNLSFLYFFKLFCRNKLCCKLALRQVTTAVVTARERFEKKRTP